MITSSIDLITIGLARLVSEDVNAITCHALRMLAMHQGDIILPRVLGLLALRNFERARHLKDAAQCRLRIGMPDRMHISIVKILDQGISPPFAIKYGRKTY